MSDGALFAGLIVGFEPGLADASSPEHVPIAVALTQIARWLGLLRVRNARARSLDDRRQFVTWKMYIHKA